MKNLKIKVKLIISFMIIAALTLVIGVVGVVSINSAADNTTLLNNRTNMVIVAADIGLNVEQQRAAYRGASTYRLMELRDETDGAIAEMQQLDSEFDDLTATLGEMLTTDEGRRLLGNIESIYATYEVARDDFMALITQDQIDYDEMHTAFNNITTPASSLAATVAELMDLINSLTDIQAEQAASTASATSLIMSVIIVVAVGISVALSLFISRMIARPLAMMQSILIQVGDTGSLEFSAETMKDIEKEGEYRDEIGQSIKAFNKMMDRLLYIGERLSDVAGGDLTAEIELVSDKDTMGNALREMNGNLNAMFAEINSVAQQVSTASGEIATGAQSLAQGSTEQASTVEEISASINEITEQANVSVETADKTARDSQTIRNIAQEGNDKMGRLSKAVQEMSDASQSIGNVIKVIDDIAFQTNILALNAAVEAARAGEHGKGFAVVADEVRNLAGKSAEAAKETSGLISANIEKSEVGLTISQETAEALRQIVEGVERTTTSLRTIAQQSEGAKAATEQVNLAVDQVAQVVQQNSATSEESAAASEEMSSQAQVLQQLIARFKLKDMGYANNAAPRMIASQSAVGAPQGYSVASSDVIF